MPHTLPYRPDPAPARSVEQLQPIPDPLQFARTLLQLQDLTGEPAEIIIRTTSGQRLAVTLTATADRPVPRRRQGEELPAVFLDLMRKGYTKGEVQKLFRIEADDRRRNEQLDQAQRLVAGERAGGSV